MKQIVIPEIPMEKKMSRLTLEKRIGDFWIRRSKDGIRRSLLEYSHSVDRSKDFPEGFITMFVTTYREALVDRAEISLVKNLMSKADDVGAVKILNGLILKLYKSDTADVNEITLLMDMLDKLVCPHQIRLLKGIINAHSVSAEIELDDDDGLAHLVMRKLLKAYGVYTPYVGYMEYLKELFAQVPQPAPAPTPAGKKVRAAQLKAERERVKSIARTKNLMNKVKNCGF